MKKALFIVSILFVAVITTACINNMAVQELNNKAAEYMQKGDYESAINRLQASLDLDSTVYQTYYNLGVAQSNAKKYENAIDTLTLGIKIKPDYPNFYYSLGAAQICLADELTAEDVFDEEKQESVKRIVSAVDKERAEALVHEANKNLEKYLEMCPECNDKNDVEELLNSIKNKQESDVSEAVVE